MNRWRGEPPRRHDGRWWERLREFSTPHGERRLDGDRESRDGGKGEEREAFSLYWQLFQPQTKTCSLCPTCLPACLPVCQPARLSPLSPPFTSPPVSLRIYGNLSVSTIFVMAWFRLARDSKPIDSFDSGCRTGFGLDTFSRDTFDDRTRDAT